MTIIRKVAFISLSVSAFVYLILQTSHGQQWLDSAAQLFSTQTSMIEQRAANTVPMQDNINAQGELIKQLEIQIGSLTSVAQTMSKNVNNLQLEFGVLSEKYEALVMKNGASVGLIEHNGIGHDLLINPLSQINAALLIDESIETKAAFNQESINNASSDQSRKRVSTLTLSNTKSLDKNERRQHHLSRQARLQDVVQKMELTALQALTK
ncbi:MAG: hypothetical protein ACJAUM_000020 [Pseudomonadales bacterium]|jgi:hypothetical protein